MIWTKEQEAIFGQQGNLKVNAVAGSGKTTTILAYAASRPSESRILYITFNKLMRSEAQRKIAAEGLKHMQAETAHSLAYKAIVHRYGYTVRAQGYKTSEIVKILGLEGSGQRHEEYMVANHILKFITYFCNSNKAKVQELNYLDTIRDEKARHFVESVYPYLETQTRTLLAKMDRKEIDIIHDFYLKKFQLSQPVLPYDYILFDEGQDASGAMLDIFLHQPAIKILVGDMHQQIYGWRYAINALHLVPFPQATLSTSFRYKQPVAQLAAAVLGLKKWLGPHVPVVINGQNKVAPGSTKAIIARTNLGLLLRAIDFTAHENPAARIFFEGNIHSYTYAEDGSSLYDVLNLHTGNRDRIRDPFIREMKDMSEMEEYIEKSEETQLGMMVEIIQRYGREIPGIMNRLKERQVPETEKHTADMIFTTLHRCKGLEYDEVELVEDFVSEAKIKKSLASIKENDREKNALSEEINLLYVAITRTKSKLLIPQALVPDGFVATGCIMVLHKEEEDDIEDLLPFAAGGFKNRFGAKSAKPAMAPSIQQVRQQLKEGNRRWTPAMDASLKKKFEQGTGIRELCDHFDRTTGVIRARLKKLDLLTD